MADDQKLNIKLPMTAAEVNAAVPPQSQTEIDRELSLVNLRAAIIREKRELLELERLEYDIKNKRNQEANEQMSHDTVEASLKDMRDHDEWHQNACTHMKGGSSESLLNGAPSQGQDATNYAMIDHTLTTGVRFRMCQRCPKTWFPKDPDYRWAMSRPTKNSPSTGCPSPGLVRNRDPLKGGPRVESEIKHKVVAPLAQPEYTQGPAGY